MDNYDPIKTVHQLRDWVEESISSTNAGSLAEAKARYIKITKVINQLQGLGISIPEDITSERRAIEEFIDASGETRILTSLANELSSLAKGIDRHLKRHKGGKANPQKLRVKFPDGTVIFENKAVDTFIKSLQCIGLQRVSLLTSVKSHGGHPIVSREKNRLAGNLREIDGYFIETKSSTQHKARQIRDIARALNVDISVGCVD